MSKQLSEEQIKELNTAADVSSEQLWWGKLTLPEHLNESFIAGANFILHKLGYNEVKLSRATEE